jgi:hypothetical protein
MPMLCYGSHLSQSTGVSHFSNLCLGDRLIEDTVNTQTEKSETVASDGVYIAEVKLVA